MIVAVADTHAALWYLSGDPRLSRSAEAIIIKAQQDGDQIGVSSISLIEIVYLLEKAKIPRDSFGNLFGALANPQFVFTEIVVDRQIAWIIGNVSRSQIPDMPDRIIAATALRHNAPVISRDGKIQLSAIATIW